MNILKKIYVLTVCTSIIYASLLFPLHFLHLSFHKGCINEIAFVVQQLNHTVTSLFIPDIPAYEWDGYAQGNALYNVGHERAEKIWKKHTDYFNQFDAVITSDTVPLARIFLQNGYEKPLIIWICNRIDYADYGSLDCEFPDERYYQLLQEAFSKKNVYLVPYTDFESFYALQKNVFCNCKTIKPIGEHTIPCLHSAIPSSVNKSNTFFVPPYLNDTTINVTEECARIGIPTYKGRYNGPLDVKDFKGIIHIPYAWSNVAFFENMRNGMPYFVPSESFIRILYDSGSIWWPNGNFFMDNCCLSEWYHKDNKDIITYFDSWDDLRSKIELTDFDALRVQIKQYAKIHMYTMLERWRLIFNRIMKSKEAL